MLRIVVLISGGGSNLQAIIDQCRSQPGHAEVVAVISNAPGAYGLKRAVQAGIPTHTIDHQRFDSRTAFDTALAKCIDQYQPGVLVLAGFMRILTRDFIEHYRGRIMNIHPSLLPALPGLNTHQRALDAGLHQHGATVHFVTPRLDHGPLILQAAVAIKPNDTAQPLAARVLQEEHRIYPKVIGWFATGRLHSDGTHALLDGKPIDNPLGLESYEN